MERVERYLETIYENRICEEYDHVLLVIGDEGVGKSTFILELMIHWQDIKGEEPDADDILSNIVHSTEGLQESFSAFPDRAAIAVPDCARVMHKKEAMTSEQIKMEQDFFDVRTNEYLVLLGYQDWDSVPSFLQDRRARGAFYIPHRGAVRGYSREALDEWAESGERPSADLRDGFPSLEGTPIWEQYKEMDKEAKAERMDVQDDEEENHEEDGLTVREVVEDLQTNGLDRVVSKHGGHGGKPYIDHELIQFEYDLSIRQAKKVKKVLNRDVTEHELEAMA